MGFLTEIVGESSGIVAVRERIGRLVARASTVRRLPPVLIQGETGSGKGLVARSLHKAGPRSAGPFVDVNCAAIPETLLEAEMFGFERGAFTDARQAKRGLFQTAHHGTLFLDEIGLLPEGLQAKLLTVLEERTVRRLGATQSEPVDVWVIAATNLDLHAATQAGRFREDLYHRLAVLTLALPPLRERRQDVLLLAEHFLARACADYGLVPKTLAPDARAALVAYRWPGNIRELINTMERVTLLTEDPLVTADALGLSAEAPVSISPEAPPATAAPPSLAAVVDTAERAHVREALEATGWNVSRAAARLGISRNTIRYRIEKHGLRPGAPAPPRRVRQATLPAALAPPPLTAAAATVGSSNPVAIRWERRRLAVLQARLASGSEAGPLDTGRVVEVLVDKVRSFGGRVEELGADGFVAMFGLEPVEQPVRRAALAAIAMQRATQQIPEGPPVPGLRIAIDLASFLLGRLPDASLVDAQDKRTVLGAMDVLVEGADPGSVVVSAPAAPFLARGFDLAPVGVGQGRRSAFRLGGLERAESAGARRSRLVGRDHELELLRSRLAAVLRGRGQVVAIAGEAGIGKSRLILELRRDLADRAVLCLEAHCLPYANPIPCLPLVEILRAACGIVETDGPDGVREKVRALLDRSGMDALEATPYLLHLLDPGEGGDAVARFTPEIVKARTFEVLRELSRRLAGRSPLVLIVEDLHWIDRTSEEYLATFVEVAAGVPILLVTTHRPGYRPPWMDKSYATQVALQPLSPPESLSLVRDVVGTAHVGEPTMEMIAAKAEGNPFFAEELARAVADRGEPTPGSPPSVPDTVEEVLMARIDRLAAEEKRVLQAAAVIGRSLPFLLLQAILDPPDESLRERLARLQGAEFLYETRAASELEYAFKHTLTHEVAYASLLPAQRRAFHARIVDALEGWQREGREESVERLAHHAIGAESWDKAVDYARRAGLQALARSAYRDAVARFEQALGSLRHLATSPDTLAQGIDLRFDLRTVLTPLGEHHRILEHLREAEEIARGLDDQRRLGRVEAYLADAYRLAGEHERAIAAGERALAVAERLGDFGLEIAANTYLGQVCHTMGRYRQGITHLGRNVERLVGDLSRQTFGLPFLSSVHSRTWLTLCLTEVGEFATGIRIGEEGVRMAESADQPLSLVSACQALGTLHVRRGDTAGAIPLLERARGTAITWSLGLWIPAVDSLLGSAYALAGRLEEAVPLLEGAVDRQRAMRRMASFALRVVGLGEAYLATGRTREAVDLAEQALGVARSQGERGSEAYALVLRADVAARAEPLDAERVDAAYREAIALAGELGMEPLVARAELGLARVWRRARRRSAAAEQLTRAAARFRDLGMDLWQAQAEEDLRLLS